MSKKDLVLSILESVILSLLAFILCAHGVGEIFRGIFQGSYSYLGVLSLTLGIVCVGIECLTLKGLKCYLRGKSCDEPP